MMDEKTQRPIKRILSPSSGLLSDSFIHQFLQTQHQRAVNEAEGIKLRGKELDHNKDLSSKYMEIKAELARERPKERRKTYTRIAYIVAALIMLSLIFIGFCLYLGKEQFLIDLIKVALYPVLTFAGYYAGKKRKPKKEKGKKENFHAAEVLAD